MRLIDRDSLHALLKYAKAGLIAYAVFNLVGCNPPSISQPQTPAVNPSPASQTLSRTDVQDDFLNPQGNTINKDTGGTNNEYEAEDFGAILKSYQDLNTRLENVSAPLLIRNAQLCPKTVNDPGFTVHTLRDYPENLQAVARVLLPVSDALSIRTVRTGSVAETFGLKPGDILKSMGGYKLASGPTARQMYGYVAQKTFLNETITLKIYRQIQAGKRHKDKSREIDFTLPLIRQCDYPVNLFFSNTINGHSDGENIWITSGLMRHEARDNQLALVIAHEMAHNIESFNKLKGQELFHNKGFELKADRMALVMMHRAGYDIEQVLSDWRQTYHPHSDDQERSDSHPTLALRLSNLSKEVARIKALEAEGSAIEF